MSEAAVWVVFSYKGLLEYREERRAETSHVPGFEYGECFHNGESLLETVHGWHAAVSKEHRKSDVVTSKGLRLIEFMMEADLDARATSKQALKQSHHIIVEARGKLGDSPDASDSSGVDSVISELSGVFSTGSSISSKSSVASIVHDAVTYFAKILCFEGHLRDKYEKAITRETEERFLRNHKRLLKKYFLDLTGEIKTDMQRHTVRALRGGLQRAQISSKVHATFSKGNPNWNELMKALSLQGIDKKANLETYLQSCTKESEEISSKDQDETRSQSSSSGSDDEEIPKESEIPSSDELQKVVEFLINGPSFKKFIENLRQFAYPPTTIREALETNDIRILEKLLVKNFEQVTENEYLWLRELQSLGCSPKNIAELLFEHTKDTPWIFFEIRPRSGLSIKHGFHRPFCAHSSNRKSADPRPGGPEDLDVPDSFDSEEEESFLKTVQESCGFAGIVPKSRDRKTWGGTVIFQNDNSTSYVSYGSTEEEDDSEKQLISCIYNALEGFCAAVAYAQDSSSCCDSYTFLRFKVRDSLPDVVEMVRIQFEVISRLYSEIQKLSVSDEVGINQCMKCGTVAEEILSMLGMPDVRGQSGAEQNNNDFDNITETLHRCSLAVQFLCLSFLSYVQAHCGAIKPFFLDTPQKNIFLKGSKQIPTHYWQVEAQLANLTCIGDMLQDSVVVFSVLHTAHDLRAVDEKRSFDFLACPEDLIDSWGPGEYIGKFSDSGDQQICAVGIGGGVIQATRESFHWSRDVIECSSYTTSILPTRKLLIGATVQVNSNCRMDDLQAYQNSSEQLENLGSFESYWQTAERQSGIQAGQYVTLGYSNIKKKTREKTLKESQLSLPNNHLLHFLQSNWGLQFSCCTGIAQRVSLCELMADVMPAFVESLLPVPVLWESLKNDHNIFEAIQHEDIQDWWFKLSEDLQKLLAAIIRYILSVMAHTGLDSNGKHFRIAWVREKSPFFCFKLNCEKKNYWTRLLADSGNCATFAYVSSKCLVTPSVQCRDAVPMWRNESSLLQTAVCRYLPGIARSGLDVTPWVLQHERWYSMGRSDDLLKVKVDRGDPQHYPRLLVYSSLIPPAFARRWLPKTLPDTMGIPLDQLREKQSKDWRAEDVVILSPD